IAQALSAGVEAAGLAVRGIHIELGVGDYLQLLAGGAGPAARFAAVGGGLGRLLRGRDGGAVGAGGVVPLVGTTLLRDVPAAGRCAPGASAGAIAGAVQTQSASKLLAPALGVLLLAGYAVAAASAGAIVTASRDVD